VAAVKVVLRNAEVEGQRCDVTVSACRAVLLEAEYVDAGVAVVEVDARGGALLPGLHDHHLHLLAMAAVSVDCSLVATLEELGDRLAEAPGQWVRATGYHESIGGDLDRHALDRLIGDRPVRVQHRSGALWILNSPALRLVSAALDDSADVERDGSGAPNGRLWRYDSHLRDALPPAEPDLAPIGDRLLRLGITSVTDATPDLDASAIDLLSRAQRDGALPHEVTLLGAPDDFVDSALLRRGPAKLLLRDHDLPDVEAVATWVAARHAAGRPVAVHCVTSDSLAITLAALDDAGARTGDRIEHAGIVPSGLRSEIARLGMHVVTNPRFLHERGDDYVSDVIPEELPFLYPHRSLLDAGVQVAAASDAPYGEVDPWAVIRAASERTTRRGRVLSGEEAIDRSVALAGYLSPAAAPGGEPLALRAGGIRGLCLLRSPLIEAISAPDANSVRLVATGGWIDSITPARRRGSR
jgi:predicted amidohydrolase YtcJ